MSHFTEQPHRAAGIHYTAEFVEEMLAHLQTCARYDVAAGFDPALVDRAVDNCRRVLGQAPGITPRVFVIDLQFASAPLTGGEVERWCKYMADTLRACFTLRTEAHLLTENWGLTGLELQEKLRDTRCACR